MTNSSANATNSKANAPNPIAKASNSIAKATSWSASATNSTAKPTNSTAKAPTSTANGTKSTAKVTNSIAKTCTTTYKHLAYLLSQKWSSPYSVVMGWLRCSLQFSLLRSSITCIRAWLTITLKASWCAPSSRSCHCRGVLNCQLSQCWPGLFLDAGALEQFVSVAGVIQLSST